MIKDFYYLSLFHQFHIITENVIVQRCSMSPHCLIISLGVLVTYICTIWFLFFFSVHFLWSWLKRLSALKEAVSFLSLLFFFCILNTRSNKRLFFPGLARPLGGFGAEFKPGHREYKEASGLGRLGRAPPTPPHPDIASSLPRHLALRT